MTFAIEREDTVSNINNLTRDDIISYYNKNYTPDKMMTILTGEFNPDDDSDDDDYDPNASRRGYEWD